MDKRGDYGEETDRYTHWLMADGWLRTHHYFNYNGILDGRYFQGSRTDDWSDMTTSEMLDIDRRRGGGVWAPERG